MTSPENCYSRAGARVYQMPFVPVQPISVPSISPRMPNHVHLHLWYVAFDFSFFSVYIFCDFCSISNLVTNKLYGVVFEYQCKNNRFGPTHSRLIPQEESYLHNLSL